MFVISNGLYIYSFAAYLWPITSPKPICKAHLRNRKLLARNWGGAGWAVPYHVAGSGTLSISCPFTSIRCDE